MKHRRKLIALAALSVMWGCADSREQQLRKLIDARLAAARENGAEYLSRPTLQVHFTSIGPDSALLIIEDSGKGDSSGPFQGFRTFEMHFACKNGQWRFTGGKIRGNYDEILSEPFPSDLSSLARL